MRQLNSILNLGVGQTIPWDFQLQDAEMGDKAVTSVCVHFYFLHVARAMEKSGFLTTSEYVHFLTDGLVL